MPIAYTPPHKVRCNGCGVPTPIALLDAKPFQGATPAQMQHAADTGADFNWLECETCYGPGWCAL